MSVIQQGRSLTERAGREGAKRLLRMYGSYTAHSRGLPDFAIIGAKRGGTTSLYNYLLEHPLIAPMFPARQRIKGTHYFDTQYWRGSEWYRSHFPLERNSDRTRQSGTERALTGEGSPYYLFHPLAPARMAADAPSTRLVVLLRDPVERAYSHYKERVRNGGEILSFEEALEQEPARLAGEEERILTVPGYLSREHEDHSYVAQGIYEPMLRRWLSFFDQERVLVLMSEDFYADPDRVANQVWSFLGLAAHELRDRRRFNYHQAPDLDGGLRRSLQERFAEHNAELAELLGRELEWTSGSREAPGQPPRRGLASADHGAAAATSSSPPTPPLPATLDGECPAVTVVVPTRDRPEMLRRAVRSIVGQDYEGAITCIVVFDRSEPVSVDVEVGEGRELRLVVNSRAPGLAGARNTGYLMASTPLLANCDDDDEWNLDKLSRQVNVMMSSGAELVSGGITIRVSEHTVERIPPASVDFGRLLRERVTEIHPSTYLFRKGAIDQGVGLVDEELPGSYGEDYEWLLRVAWRRPVISAPDVLVTVHWNQRSYFSKDWETIADALSYLLVRHPELSLSHSGRARIKGQIAFAEAAGGKRLKAAQTAASALRDNPLERRAYLALAVACRLVRAPWVLKVANWRGHGI